MGKSARMTEYDGIMSRTKIKYVCSYLMNGGEFGPYVKQHDITLDEMLDNANGSVDKLVDADIDEGENLREAITAYGDDYYRVGFSIGIKAGVKLLFNLMDSGELYF